MASTNYLLKSKLKKARLLLQSRRLDDAKSVLEQLSQKETRNPDVWLLLGVVCGKLGLPAEAAENFKKAYIVNPNDSQITFNMGIALRDCGNYEKAVPVFQKTLDLQPRHPVAEACLADALMQLGRMNESEAVFRSAIRNQPDNAELHSNLGSLLQASGRVAEAVDFYSTAIRINPELPAYDSYGSALSEQGRFTEAFAVYREGLRRQPNNARVYSNLLLDMNYIPDLSKQEIFDEHCKWGLVHGYPPGQLKAHKNSVDKNKRLRIGYVSPDFRNHSVAFYIEPLIASHNRDRVEVYCYSVMPRPDEMTRRIRRHSDHWRGIYGKTARQVADEVIGDEIDILVDLAGHTAHNSLAVFALKPAPVQVSYLGYPNTTGLKSIDYRLTDDRADPAGQGRFYCEQLVRLPGCFLCYKPPEDAPEVATLPALDTGTVTFGSFNNLTKITPDVIALWCRVVKSVPGSRLLVKNPSLTDQQVRQQVCKSFESNGLDTGQVELIGHTPTRQEHLGLYGNVDIALDTFPYNGTTTTCEALWMGVPVVTLTGDRHAGRVGYSLLWSIGFAEWAARGQQQFIEIAAGLAADPERLAGIRKKLRNIMAGAQLCDMKSFSDSVENAYRGMWHVWCDSQ